MTRDERQDITIELWKKANGIGTFLAKTGFGKTVVAIKVIIRYIKVNPLAKILIVVPSKPLKKQWEIKIKESNLNSNCKVEVINTVIKHDWDINLLIIDEVHRVAAPSFQKVFVCVKYNRLLCLTATLERIDGMEYIIKRYAPVFDEVTAEECLINNWVAEYVEYKVLIDVDLTEYEKINVEFFNAFSYFDYDLNWCLSAIKRQPQRIKFARDRHVSIKQVNAKLFTFVRLMKERKSWILNHPKKIEIANKILDKHIKDKKILTFSASLDQAKALNYGDVIHYKTSKKNREQIIDNFTKSSNGVIHSINTLKEGLDVPGVSMAVLVGYDSSVLKKIQTIGRTIRKEGDKVAEIYTLVIRNTVEEQWFDKSSRAGDYLTIDESMLEEKLNSNIGDKSGLYIE